MFPAISTQFRAINSQRSALRRTDLEAAIVQNANTEALLGGVMVPEPLIAENSALAAAS